MSSRSRVITAPLPLGQISEPVFLEDRGLDGAANKSTVGNILSWVVYALGIVELRNVLAKKLKLESNFAGIVGYSRSFMRLPGLGDHPDVSFTAKFAVYYKIRMFSVEMKFYRNCSVAGADVVFRPQILTFIRDLLLV